MFKKFVLLMLFVCLAFITPNVSFAFFFSSPESIVQKAPFPFDQSTTTRELLEGYSYFDKKSMQWSNYKTNQGRTVVEFRAKYIPSEKNINDIISLANQSRFVNDKYLNERIVEGWVFGFKDDIAVPIDIVFQATLNKNDTFSVAVGAERNGVPLKIEPSVLIQILIENKEIDNALFYVLYSDDELQKLSFDKFESMRKEKRESILVNLREKLPQAVGTRFVIEVLPDKYGMKYDPCFEVVSIVNVINNTLDIELNAYCIKFNSEPSCKKVVQKRFMIEGENSSGSPYTQIAFRSIEHNLDFNWTHKGSDTSKAVFDGNIGYTKQDYLYKGLFRIGDLLTDDPCQTLPNLIEDRPIHLK